MHSRSSVFSNERTSSDDILVDSQHLRATYRDPVARKSVKVKLAVRFARVSSSEQTVPNVELYILVQEVTESGVIRSGNANSC